MSQIILCTSGEIKLQRQQTVFKPPDPQQGEIYAQWVPAGRNPQPVRVGPNHQARIDLLPTSY